MRTVNCFIQCHVHHKLFKNKTNIKNEEGTTANDIEVTSNDKKNSISSQVLGTSISSVPFN
jgi:hypothetical protein